MTAQRNAYVIALTMKVRITVCSVRVILPFPRNELLKYHVACIMPRCIALWHAMLQSVYFLISRNYQ